jgi:hypothetical protein
MDLRGTKHLNTKWEAKQEYHGSGKHIRVSFLAQVIICFTYFGYRARR